MQGQNNNLPDYSGDGVAVWVNTTKNGAPYLTIQLFGRQGIKINAFKVVPKQIQPENTENVK